MNSKTIAESNFQYDAHEFAEQNEVRTCWVPALSEHERNEDVDLLDRHPQLSYFARETSNAKVWQGGRVMTRIFWKHFIPLFSYQRSLSTLRYVFSGFFKKFFLTIGPSVHLSAVNIWIQYLKGLELSYFLGFSSVGTKIAIFTHAYKLWRLHSFESLTKDFMSGDMRMRV